MKRKFTMMVAVVALALTAGSSGAVSIGDYPAGTAANGIAGTRHNMGGLGRVITTNNTSEICVFCHTPHHTNTANNLKPLWNRGSQAPAAFTAYGTTIAGTAVANTDIGSTSLACLSCHDGVTTFDNLVNAPGKAGVTAGGADRGWSFSMPTPTFGLPSPVIHNFTTSVLSCGACHNSAADQGANVTRLLVGSDLSNDHPVSIAYISGTAGLRTTDTVISSINLTSDLASSAATAFSANLLQNRWAVKGFISDTATIADLLRNGKVECSSCHDPHFDNRSWDEAEPTWADGIKTTWCGNDGEACSDGQFLRRVGGNTGSGVCRTCHNK